LIVGICGFKGSGKTFIADHLVTKGFQKLSFSSAGKAAVRLIYNLNSEQLYGDLKEEVDPRYGLTPRYIMQRFMTEVCRSIHPDTWVFTVEQYINQNPDQDVVIDDVRFENEVVAIKRWGGTMWRVERYGLVGAILATLHDSERPDLLKVDRVIQNQGSVEDLAASI